jgi:hypothetical protein
MNSRKLALLLTLLCLVVSTYAGTKVTCVGASITYGAFIDDRQHSSFPGQLQQLPGNQYSVRNLGVNDTTILKNGNQSGLSGND